MRILAGRHPSAIAVLNGKGLNRTRRTRNVMPAFEP